MGMLINDYDADSELSTLPEQNIHQCFLGTSLMAVEYMMGLFKEDHEPQFFTLVVGKLRQVDPVTQDRDQELARILRNAVQFDDRVLPQERL